MEKLGIESVKDLSTAVAKICDASFAIFEDGRITFADLRHLPKVVTGIKSMSVVDFKSVLPELQDLDDAEREDLAAHFKKVFVIPSNKAMEETIEEGFGYVLMGIQALFTFIDLGSKFRQ